jgi:hypothetical protein
VLSEKARSGHVQACIAIMRNSIPQARERGELVLFPAMPPLRTPDDAMEAIAALAAAVAGGELTGDDAAALLKVIDAFHIWRSRINIALDELEHLVNSHGGAAYEETRSRVYQRARTRRDRYGALWRLVGDHIGAVPDSWSTDIEVTVIRRTLEYHWKYCGIRVDLSELTLSELTVIAALIRPTGCVGGKIATWHAVDRDEVASIVPKITLLQQATAFDPKFPHFPTHLAAGWSSTGRDGAERFLAFPAGRS